jgi:hypothetical protein
MKNFKNMLSAAALMVVLGVGAASANTGLLITDKTTTQPCTFKNSLLTQLSGIIIVGMPSLDGIIIVDRIACQSNETDGIIIVDRNGIIIVD